MKNSTKAAIAPHTIREYSAATHTAYRMLADGCPRRDVVVYTGIPTEQMRKIMTTECGKALVAGVLERAGKKIDPEKIKSIQTGEMGPETFAESLRRGRVRLKVTQAQLDEIVKDHAQWTLQNPK